MNQILDYGNSDDKKKKKNALNEQNKGDGNTNNNITLNSNLNDNQNNNQEEIVISPKKESLNNAERITPNNYNNVNSNYNSNNNINADANMNTMNNNVTENDLGSRQNYHRSTSSMDRFNNGSDSYYDMNNFNVNNNRKSSGTKKKIIIIVLVLVAIIAAIIAVIVVKKNIENSKNVEALKEKIQITILNEDNNTIAFNISSINPVEKIVYSWNSQTDKEQEIDGKGRREITERGIEIPIGSNMIKVSVIDVEGNTQTAEKTFESDIGKDIKKPEINITNQGAVIEVKVTDDVGLKEAKSRMGDDKEAIYPAKKDAPGEIKFQVTAKEGTETLVVVATDLAGNVTTVEREIKGVARPKVTVEQTSDTSKIVIKAQHNVGIAKIEFELNGQAYIKTYDQNDPNNKAVELTQELAPGENTIKVKATSIEGYESNIFSSRAIRNVGAYQTPYSYPQNTQTNVQNQTNTGNTNVNYNTGYSNTPRQYPNMNTNVQP